MLTLKEAAAELGVDPATLRQQIKAGALRGKRFGPVWTITRAELERYRREHLGRFGPKPRKRKQRP
jgi:excisionase family DNA binding protein